MFIYVFINLNINNDKLSIEILYTNLEIFTNILIHF